MLQVYLLDHPMTAHGLIASQLRPGHPDFLDLPWQLPLGEWLGQCQRLEELPRGEARHPVVFVDYDGRLYALKALPPGAAEAEYRALSRMQELKLPVVVPVGHVAVHTAEGGGSVLLTRYLDHSLPYHALFLKSSLLRYRDHLLDALAGLLVQLHIGGVYWGDCSLYNTLFLRDAGRLQACLVDAETSLIRPRIEEGMRASDLDIMEENVAGALTDLVAVGALTDPEQAFAAAAHVRRRYEELWREVSREEVIRPSERFRIEERVRALNGLGFSVGEIDLASTDEGGEQLRIRLFVSDRTFHSDMLHSLTGLETQEQQARLLVNEIQQLRAALSEQRQRSLPLAAAAWSWLTDRYEPLVDRLQPAIADDESPVELYCRLLEHKWYLSEQAQQDVGHDTALGNFLLRFAP